MIMQDSKLTFSFRCQLVTKGKILVANSNFLVTRIWLRGSMQLCPKKMLVHKQTSVFHHLVKTFYQTKILIHQGEISIHCPENKSLFIGFTSLQCRELLVPWWQCVDQFFQSVPLLIPFYSSLFLSCTFTCTSLLLSQCYFPYVSSFEQRYSLETLYGYFWRNEVPMIAINETTILDIKDHIIALPFQ